MGDPSALLSALYRADRAAVDRLLAGDPDLDIFEAAALGRAERLRALLDGDPALARAWSPDGFTALHLAAFTDEAEAARLLVEGGADLEARSRHEEIRGVRPMNTAAFARAHAVARVLLDAGADPNGTGEAGGTALHTAAQYGDVEMARLLLDHGADPDARTDDGRTPRDLAQGAVVHVL